MGPDRCNGDEDALAAVAATVPLGRMARPADVTDACLLLASPLAGYITGANLVVNGGQRPAYADAARPKLAECNHDAGRA